MELVRVSLEPGDPNDRTALIRVPNRESAVRDVLHRDYEDPEERMTLIHALQYRGDAGVIQSLLPFPDLNRKDNNGDTPLRLAACAKNLGAFKWLLCQDGIDAESEDKYGKTLLWTSAFQGQIGIVRLLVMRSDVNVNFHDNKGMTPLMVATREGHEAVVQSLLGKSGIEVNKRDDINWNALQFAKEYKRPGVIELLLKHGVTESADTEAMLEQRDVDSQIMSEQIQHLEKQSSDQAPHLPPLRAFSPLNV